MDRLTIPDVRVDEHTTRRSIIDVLAVQEHAMEIYHQLKIYEDIAELFGGIDSLRELAEADKDGRVVVQPCKVGDILYRVFAGEIFEHRVGRMKYFAIQGRWDIETYPFCPCVESSIGKTIFLSHKEAEKALRKMEGKKDGKT